MPVLLPPGVPTAAALSPIGDSPRWLVRRAWRENIARRPESSPIAFPPAIPFPPVLSASQDLFSIPLHNFPGLASNCAARDKSNRDLRTPCREYLVRWTATKP